VGQRSANCLTRDQSTCDELMTTFYGRQAVPSSPAASLALVSRRPQRITFTAHWQLHQRLQQRADEEGRSLSNLIGHLLEVATAG
jgi:hypothetical protein